MSMEYFIMEVEEINSGVETEVKFVYKADSKDAEEKSVEIIENWRGPGTRAEEDEEFFDFGDGSWARVSGLSKIPKKDFDVLSKYLSVL
jgi:hypothetical protein